MEKDVFAGKVSALRKQIMDLKYEICDLADQYIAESQPHPPKGGCLSLTT